MKTRKIFLLAGRTGGPIIPLLAIFRNIEKIHKQEISNKKLTTDNFNSFQKENKLSVSGEIVENRNSEKNEKKNNLESSGQNSQKSDLQETDLENGRNGESFEGENRDLGNFEEIIIGVRGGFEENLAVRESLKIAFLPQAKVDVLTFKIKKTWQGILELGVNLGKTFLSLVLLVWSLVKSFYLIWYHKPVAIFSSGSFLAIPMLISAKVYNFLPIFPKIKIITHQQDPLPGLASRLTFGLGDIQTCVFESSFPQNSKIQIIPNPLDFTKFNFTKSQIITKLAQNLKFQNFLKRDLESVFLEQKDHNLKKTKENSPQIIETANHESNTQKNLVREENSADVRKENSNLTFKKDLKPILLIFGGGSGSLFINNWVKENLNTLTQHFRVIHLSGVLQSKKLNQSLNQISRENPNKNFTTDSFTSSNIPNSQKNEHSENIMENGKCEKNLPDYLLMESLLEEMPLALKLADLVICRAGLSSIGELLYLNKPSFLVPLPDSHQEINAKSVQHFFPILEQKNSSKWLETIINWQQIFSQIKYPEPTEIENKLANYYDQVYQKLIKKS